MSSTRVGGRGVLMRAYVYTNEIFNVYYWVSSGKGSHSKKQLQLEIQQGMGGEWGIRYKPQFSPTLLELMGKFHI